MFHKYCHCCHIKHRGIITILDLWNPWGYVTDMLKCHGGLENILCLCSKTYSTLGGLFWLCSANHKAGYFSNMACDWRSIDWAYSEQETENGPGLPLVRDGPLGASAFVRIAYQTTVIWVHAFKRVLSFLSVCHTLLIMFPSSYHHEIFRSCHHEPG